MRSHSYLCSYSGRRPVLVLDLGFARLHSITSTSTANAEYKYEIPKLEAVPPLWSFQLGLAPKVVDRSAGRCGPRKKRYDHGVIGDYLLV